MRNLAWAWLVSFLFVGIGLSPSIAMTYHDNEVYFKMNKDLTYKLVGGSFTVTGLSITSGQDPDGYNYVGMIKSFSSDGKISFKVGRDPSKTVADWFTGQISSSQNTFDHDPDKLSFAFLGTLEITFSGGNLAPYQQTYTINNVMLAQGQDFLSNNWWYGGKVCSYVKDNYVTCTGSSPTSGVPGLEKFGLSADFKRGGSGNGVNEVEIKSITIPTYSTKALSSEYVGENASCVWQPSSVCPPYVVYYDWEDERRPVELSVNSSGKLINKVTGILFDTSGADLSDGRAIFVMNSSGIVYASNQGKRYLFHHSTLLGGRSVAAAGELVVSSGVLQSASNCSGHYKPPADLTKQVFESLSRQEYNFSFTPTYNTCSFKIEEIVVGGPAN